jgi:hypothetical protein
MAQYSLRPWSSKCCTIISDDSPVGGWMGGRVKRDFMYFTDRLIRTARDYAT